MGEVVKTDVWGFVESQEKSKWQASMQLESGDGVAGARDFRSWGGLLARRMLGVCISILLLHFSHLTPTPHSASPSLCRGLRRVFV